MSVNSNKNQNIEASANASSDSGILADVSVDYGSQTDASSDSRVSVKSGGSTFTLWSVNSDKTEQARAPSKEGNWEFVLAGVLYIGKYRETIESTKGEKLRLEFHDGSRFAVLKEECSKTTPVTITRPPRNDLN